MQAVDREPVSETKSLIYRENTGNAPETGFRVGQILPSGPFSGQTSAGFLALHRPESSLLVAIPFPVTACREIGPSECRHPAPFRPDCRGDGPRSREFPVSSLLIRESARETGSLATGSTAT